MFHLPPQPLTNENAYYQMLQSRVTTAIAASGLSAQAKAFLDTARVKKILLDKPKDLLDHHTQLLPTLYPGLTPAIYDNYLTAKYKQKKRRSAAEILLVSTYKPILAEVAKAFNYNDFVTGHKITSYKLAGLLNRNTCTYCNRLYTTTVIVKDAKTGRVNDKTRITRPNYDHWYSHGKYPVLGVSLYNLIPSCTVCNSSVKGVIDFSLTKHVHPYTNAVKQNFSFNYRHKTVHQNNVTIDVAARTKISRTLAAFKTVEIYNEHSAYELKDLLELRYKYSENYLDTLFNKTFKLPVGEKEAYRMIFGTEYEDIDHHLRPFSKFKKDILEKLGVKF